MEQQTLPTLDDLVDWEQLAAGLGEGPSQTQPQPDSRRSSKPFGFDDAAMDASLDLALANVDEDDFTFHALQHFSTELLPPQDEAFGDVGNGFATPMEDFPALQWEFPEVPCTQCALGGYSCKKIREGACQGFCTSCVALMIDCSFGGVVPQTTTDVSSANLAPQAWPTFRDYSSDASESIMEQTQPINSTAAMNLVQGLVLPSDSGVVAKEGEAQATPAPKVGARLSRESVRALKNWLSTHSRHPYPSDEEKEMLQRQTGLSKTQIANWLANARRRGKVGQIYQRSMSPHIGNQSSAIEIPRRPGTPALESMNPLQRWQNSPPEHEPASVTDIAKAVSSSGRTSSGFESPNPYTDDGSSRSLCNQSSVSSFGTSSNGSKGSAYSHGSRNSFGSFGSGQFGNRAHRRRRRRTVPRQNPETKTALQSNKPLKTFQCTFCTETFRTKHDWQRHEKSLHLSLERWVCAPEGPRVFRAETGQECCAFCGEANPSDEHVEAHNHSTCKERTMEERTFYRKDHLNQHLRLVHNVKFADWSMKGWKVATPDIKSRCGFCGTMMDKWATRVDHLADHFKSGSSMADWQGDWGFDSHILALVENSVPPYLIHLERLSPLPYIAGQSPPESPRTAYELVKTELAYFIANHTASSPDRQPPSAEELIIEACRIVFASETLSLQGIATQQSWLRDIFFSNKELADTARFGPLRNATENRLATLKINGKDNLFEECPLEIQLQEFVQARSLLGLTAMDAELKEEACKIVGRIEETSTAPSESVANWLVKLIQTSGPEWLGPFRRRAHLPRSEDITAGAVRSTDQTVIDSTIHNYSRLERELSEFLKMQRSIGVEPSNEDLQRQARIIIYEFDDGWNQTAADNITWLEGFRDRHPAVQTSPAESGSTFSHLRMTNSVGTPSGQTSLTGYQGEIARLPRDNCYQHLYKDLGRYVKSAMSPHNPNQHIPTDEELVYQARWIIHNDDDPWNWTAADNNYWLQSFKRAHGILPPDAEIPTDQAFGACPSQTFCPDPPLMMSNFPVIVGNGLSPQRAAPVPVRANVGVQNEQVKEAVFEDMEFGLADGMMM